MPYYMEDNLHMPLSEAMKFIQYRILTRTNYLGIKSEQNPLDFWVYQEIIYETKPDVIIEIGNNWGGTTLALAHLCDNLDHGRIIGVDLSHERVDKKVKDHKRITFITGDACNKFNEVKSLIKENETVLIIEDSSHTYENTLNILNLYSDLVKVGGYFIVEDSICHHGLDVGPKPGPYEAIESFIKKNSSFEIDRSRETFLVTWNPKGYIRRVKKPS